MAFQKDSFEGYWKSYPENHLGQKSLETFLSGSPEFPKVGLEGRFASFYKIALERGNWLVLTYQFAQGHELFGTIFSSEGKVLGGKHLVSIPEVPEGIVQLATIGEQGVFTLEIETPTDFDEEGLPISSHIATELWQISPSGKFVEQ